MRLMLSTHHQGNESLYLIINGIRATALFGWNVADDIGFYSTRQLILHRSSLNIMLCEGNLPIPLRFVLQIGMLQEMHAQYARYGRQGAGMGARVCWDSHLINTARSHIWDPTVSSTGVS